MSYDIITRSISQLNDPILTTIATLIHNDLIYMIIVLGLLFLEKDKEKQKKVLVALVLVVVLGMGLKEIFQIERPCDQLLAKITCPDGYAFPSVHSVIAFTMAVAFLYRPNYGWHLGFALMVASSRIYLGVHSLEDVAASLVLAVIGYTLVDRLWRKYYGK